MSQLSLWRFGEFRHLGQGAFVTAFFSLAAFDEIIDKEENCRPDYYINRYILPVHSYIPLNN